MFDNSRPDAETIESPPNYDLTDKGLVTSLSVGAGLMVATIGMMILTADTALGGLVTKIYSIPILGIILFGGLISVGRYLGLKGVRDDESVMAVIGSALLVFAYGCFGGGILHLYSADLYASAIAVTGGITIAITLVAATVVYYTDRNFEKCAQYSGYCFIGAIVTGLVGTLVPLILILAFGLALLGFLLDLVYEIWMTSNQNRPAYANGIGLYVAFAGVFVHVLQIVLMVMSDR